METDSPLKTEPNKTKAMIAIVALVMAIIAISLVIKRSADDVSDRYDQLATGNQTQ